MSTRQAEKVSCPECSGTGGLLMEGDCSDCNGKGFDWEPVDVHTTDAYALDRISSFEIRAGLPEANTVEAFEKLFAVPDPKAAK